MSLAAAAATGHHRPMRYALVLALAGAACGGKNAAPSSQPIEPAPAAAEPAPAPVIESPRAALAYLAPDADIVLGVDVQGLMTAPILAPYRDQMLASAPDELRQLREQCGLDPIGDLRWIIFGFNAKTERGVMVIRGDFTQQKIESCLEASGAGAKVSSEGDLRVYDFGDDKVVARWLGPGAVVATSDEAGGAEVLGKALGSGGLSGALAARVDEIDNGSHLWMVSGEQVFGQAPIQGVTGLRVFARATEIISAGLVMDFVDAAKADATKTQLDMALGQLGPMVGPEMVPIAQALQLAVVGTALEARIELSAEQIKTIADFVGKNM